MEMYKQFEYLINHLNEEESTRLAEEYFVNEEMWRIMGKFGINSSIGEFRTAMYNIEIPSLNCPYCGSKVYFKKNEEGMQFELYFYCSNCEHKLNSYCNCATCLKIREIASIPSNKKLIINDLLLKDKG